MQLQRVSLGPLRTNCYILCCDRTGQAVVIDPGAHDPALEAAIRGIEVREIVATHGHSDHVSGAPYLQERFGATLSVHPDELPCLERWAEEGKVEVRPDNFVGEGDLVEVGSLRLVVQHTPGHSPGHIVLVEEWERWLFTGDLLLKGGTGGANVPGGDPEAFVRSMNRLRELEGDWTIYPGHMEPTTLSRERERNPYIRFRVKGAKTTDVGSCSGRRSPPD